MDTDEVLDLLVSIERYTTGTCRGFRREHKVYVWTKLRDEALSHEIGKDEHTDALVRLALDRLDSLLVG
jgi:hypothetical protein